MQNETKWEELKQDEEMAYFRADLCLYSTPCARTSDM